jgi:hypothetical protein
MSPSGWHRRRELRKAAGRRAGQGGHTEIAKRGESDRKTLAQERAALAKETSRTERAIERYQEAFEAGELNVAHFSERLSARSGRAWMRCTTATKHSLETWRQANPPHPIQRRLGPWPIVSITSSPTASASRPRRCSAPSSMSFG